MNIIGHFRNTLRSFDNFHANGVGISIRIGIIKLPAIINLKTAIDPILIAARR